MKIKILLQSVSDYDRYLKIKKIESSILDIQDKLEHFYSLDEDVQESYREEFTDLHIERNLLKNQLESFEVKSVVEKIKSNQKSYFSNYDGSKKIIIFSGSGISAESGIKTFRGEDGLWNNYKISEVCSEDTFLDNIELVHSFYNQRRKELSKVEPNIVHKSIAKIEEKYGDDCYIITQNVDDLLERAGCNRVLHVHGFLTEMQCLNCNEVWDIKYDEFKYSIDFCPHCKNVQNIKPNVVFFGGIVTNYSEMFKAFDSLKNPNSIILVIGTQGNVINISNILKNFHCHKILNNLEKNEYIDDSQFENIFYDNATIAISKINQIIDDSWAH